MKTEQVALLVERASPFARRRHRAERVVCWITKEPVRQGHGVTLFDKRQFGDVDWSRAAGGRFGSTLGWLRLQEVAPIVPSRYPSARIRRSDRSRAPLLRIER